MTTPLEESNPNQPPLDIAYWDRPDDAVVADLVAQGYTAEAALVMTWATKNAAIAFGYRLEYPPPPESSAGWTKIPAG
jgi:hypothetical protein